MTTNNTPIPDNDTVITAPHMRVLELLSQNYPDASAAASEIINLEAILNLPKGTEHFVADLHGEHEAFSHILRNASGNIKRKVNELFYSSMRTEEISQLCTLIYYPGRKLVQVRNTEKDLKNFYHITLHRLVRVLQEVSSKYTRSKVRKSLPPEYAYIIEELLHETPDAEDKQMYYDRIVETIISTGQADHFIQAICRVIQRLSIDQLHILGDIYDRGQGAHLILDMLRTKSNFDIQWGNHDALWMGAAAGNEACIANVIRISLRYDNMNTLEDGYGINLVPLVTFAMETYSEDPCKIFEPKVGPTDVLSQKNRALIAKMHKAIAVIQWKLEAALINRYPDWGMQSRLLLDKIDFEKGTVRIGDTDYPMLDTSFPTIDPADPYRLTPEEKELVQKLVHSFTMSDKLRDHMLIFLSHGSLYKVQNSNLMFHASIPLNEDGTLRDIKVGRRKVRGKQLLDAIERQMRYAFDENVSDRTRRTATDFYLYLWCGPDSPLFDKGAMTTFERYFVADKATHHEEKGHYYTLRERADICDMILDDFGVTGEARHIINGHVPVKAAKGESPIKADGRLMVIDGGFSKAYHNTTGIAGYTLVYHSRCFQLVQHEPFTSAEEAVRNATDIVSTANIVEMHSRRIRVRDTDKGKLLQSRINELHDLLRWYAAGRSTTL